MYFSPLTVAAVAVLGMMLDFQMTAAMAITRNTTPMVPYRRLVLCSFWRCLASRAVLGSFQPEPDRSWRVFFSLDALMCVSVLSSIQVQGLQETGNYAL